MPCINKDHFLDVILDWGCKQCGARGWAEQHQNCLACKAMNETNKDEDEMDDDSIEEREKEEAEVDEAVEEEILNRENV